MSPKPILKRAVSEFVHKTDSYDTQGYPSRAHGVHFPPSPATRTYSAYSAAAYDRSPIVVAPTTVLFQNAGVAPILLMSRNRVVAFPSPVTSTQGH
jgi:hypothetical protein